MKLPARARLSGSLKGQALVEFGLMLPVLALLLILAVDVGRVFFSWVSLHNAARMGANYAGLNPDGWDPGDTAKQDAYEQLITDGVAGCELVAIDPPAFEDVDGDGDAYGWGDKATVDLSCDFQTFMPLADALVGDPMAIGAEAVFPVRTGAFEGPDGSTGGGGGPEPCTLATVPYLIGRPVADAENEWYVEAEFEPGTLLVFPSEATSTWVVATQSLEYQDCVDPSTTITLTAEEPSVCSPGFAPVPTLLGETVADAKNIWAESFGGEFRPNNAIDEDVVLTQATDPSGELGECIPTTASVTVTWGDAPAEACDVPNMVGKTESEARDLWDDAGFERDLKRTGNGSEVKNQDPGHPGRVGCETEGTIQLGKSNAP